MIKAAALFLVVIVALALFGRFRVGRSKGRPRRPQTTVLPARRCTGCGRFLLDSAPCPCGGKSRS